MAQQAIDDDKLPEELTIHDEHDSEGIVSDIKQLDVSSDLSCHVSAFGHLS
jgi:hypothetical protein